MIFAGDRGRTVVAESSYFEVGKNFAEDDICGDRWSSIHCRFKTLSDAILRGIGHLIIGAASLKNKECESKIGVRE